MGMSKDKQYELNEAEILALIAEGVSLSTEEDTGFSMTEDEKRDYIERHKDKLIKIAQRIAPVPFP